MAEAEGRLRFSSRPFERALRGESNCKSHSAVINWFFNDLRQEFTRRAKTRTPRSKVSKDSGVVTNLHTPPRHFNSQTRNLETGAGSSLEGQGGVIFHSQVDPAAASNTLDHMDQPKSQFGDSTPGQNHKAAVPFDVPCRRAQGTDTPMLSRRGFLKHSVGATTVLMGLSDSRVLGANERIVVGVMGVGGRGTWLAEKFAARPDVAIAYVCDPDARRLGPAKPAIEKTQGRAPIGVQDFRRMLEDKSVDAVITATPDHWHALGTILACQAGKDVYVEKPMSHNIWEGRKMVEAARKHRRVVTVGMQSRSAAYVREAIDLVRSGRLGDIHLVRVFNLMQHPMSKTPNQPPPPELDDDLWCGPAARSTHDATRKWLNFFEYSCGPIPGDAVHQLDLARLLMGDPSPPKSVSATSALRVLRDGRDTPDTQLATFEYDGFVLQFEGALWTPYMTKTPLDQRDKDLLPNWPFNATRIEVLGTRGFLYLGRHGDGWQLIDENAKPIATRTGRQGDAAHIENFLQCVRSRALPAADVEQGHQSALLCHLANIAFRAEKKSLVFDAQTESFPDAPEANQLLRRKDRQPWVVPERV